MIKIIYKQNRQLTRTNGQYAPLTLSMAAFDGSVISPQFSYSWLGPTDAVAVADKNKTQINVNKVGEYIVNISNGFQQCSQKIALSGTACAPAATATNFCTGQAFSPDLQGAPLPNLAVGDIITAGAFEFTITQVDNPTQPFKGKATMNILNGPGNLKAGLKTEFAGISINECYQVTAVPAQNLTTYFRSEYDPGWGNVFDLSSKTPKPAEPGEEIAALIAVNEKIATEMESISGSCAQRDLLVQYLAEINAIMAQIQASTDYTAAEKADLLLNQNNITIPLNSLVGVGGCLVCTPTGGRLAAPENVNCATISKEDFDGVNASHAAKNVANLQSKPIKVMIFANGYRFKEELCTGNAFLPYISATEHPYTNGKLNLNTSIEYWDKNNIDGQFISRRSPKIIKYIDGHHSIKTSNHVINNSIDESIQHFATQMGVSYAIANPKKAVFAASLLLKHPYVLAAVIPLATYCNLTDDCLALDVVGNTVGYNTRKANGRDAAKAFIADLDKNGNLKKVKLEIDIVAHSMGFAYAQGFIAGVKDIVADPKNNYPSNLVDWSGYYIIAPENACADAIDASSAWEQVYQYGSNEVTEKKYLQDGVAPQCAIIGIGNNRVYIPEKYKNNDKVPIGYVASHSVNNYTWILDRISTQSGYVIQK